jgi:uncharacterized membrane protein YdjX (TVP38/TMEM64 family)
MRSRTVLKVVVLLLLAGGMAALWFSPLRGYLTREHIGQFITWLRGLWYGPIVLIFAYAVACVFVLPASIFVLSAGIIWGWKLGTLYSMCGGMLGACAAYFAGRFLGEGLLERFGRAGAAVSKQVENAGFKSMLIARLIPGPPFALWNYAAGIARMKFSDYFFATLIGILPANILFTYCADALFHGTMSQGEAFRKLAIVGALLISLIVATGYLKRKVAPSSAK